jgi:hypothetical protein
MAEPHPNTSDKAALPVVTGPHANPPNEAAKSIQVTGSETNEHGHELREWVATVGDYVPFFQTLLWIILIVWLIQKFRTELGAIVQAVKKRIEDGAGLKAGPIELAELIRPQSSAEQAARLENEISESVESDAEGDEDDSSGESSDSSGIEYTRNRYILAEDLVLRKLQEEYGSLVNRQVTNGAEASFDGFFVKDNHPYGVEVKYVRGGLMTPQFLAITEGIHRRIRAVGWRKFTLLFVVVTDDETPPPDHQLEFFRARLEELPGTTVLRVFRFRDLADEFGINK